MPECPTCGESFDTEMGVKVHHPQIHGNSIAMVERVCKNCGKEFEILNWKDNSDNGREYCSMDCVYDDAMPSGEDHPRWSGGRPTRTCEYCGEEFQRQEDKRKKRTVGYFCSNECYGEYLHENMGPEDANFWKGGVSFTEYYGDEWQPIREKALERDGHTCQVCGCEETPTRDSFSVHHIVKLNTYRGKYDEPECYERANRLDNLITVCHPCHKKIEDWGVRPTRG